MPPPRQGMGGGGMGGGNSVRSQPPGAPRSAPPPIPARSTGGGSMPPLPAGGGYGGGAGLSGGPPLSVIYQGEKHGVTKDRFVIGRGKQSSDLTLKDPNVSRQHAMIEYHGQRIARKQIAEGDTFRICDHDLRFTYR